MSKLGKQFELVVHDVVKEIERDATVTQGEWVEGPDGARELDVLIEGIVGGKIRRIHIECRDYNPESRPIGIAQIDALESKHRDLGVDLSLLCSNAGFSVDAVRKAKRSGIGLVGVLRENDPRIRYRVVDEVYIRRIDVAPKDTGIIFGFADKLPPQGNLDVKEILFEGVPVFNWLLYRVQIFLMANPVVNGVHQLTFRFKWPVHFALPFGVARTNNVQVKFELTGEWIAQRIEIDATSGLYNWIRQTILPGSGEFSIKYKDIKVGEGGTPIPFPPNFDPARAQVFLPGEVSMWILDLGGLDAPQPIPKLDPFVEDEDLEWVRKDLPPESYISKPPKC